MGFLGWTEQQTLDTTIPAIELAYEGWFEAQRIIRFGPQSPAPSQPKTPAPASAVMDAIRRAAAPT